ncbi:MAG: ParB/RepB/Spo0J family partition protein [Salaquimonas sp.]|jgi:ParB family chromosome partitioning protein|nr:ParB/RepB/Spo0J family partition protein [Salaquimonas sp.]
MAEDNSRKRLGRGLAALIGDLDVPATATRAGQETRADRKVPIELIRANPANPRRFFNEEELGDLSRSIAEHGIVQPILVRPIREDADLGGARYEIIAGERRWRAAQKAGLHDVPVLIRDVEDRQALELAIIENVQRTDLNAIEEAQGYQQLIDEYDYSQADLGQVIGKSRSHVANTLRLMKLPEAVKRMVADGGLSAGHARALITVDNPQKLADRIVRDGLSVRQTEALAQAVSDAPKGGSAKKEVAQKSADTLALENRLGDLLGLKVDIHAKDNGSGELKIRYRTVEQLDEVCRRLENGS